MFKSVLRSRNITAPVHKNFRHATVYQPLYSRPITRPLSATSIRMTATNEWLVIVKDLPGQYEKRMEIRPTHLANLKTHPQSGAIVMGGGTLQRSLTESGGKPEIDGSVLLAVYDTRDEVVARVRDDIYAREGVWDVDNMQIIPFKTAVRTAL